MCSRLKRKYVSEALLISRSHGAPYGESGWLVTVAGGCRSDAVARLFGRRVRRRRLPAPGATLLLLQALLALLQTVRGPRTHTHTHTRTHYPR